MAFSWKLYGDGKTPPLGEAVAPDERLSWPRTVGIGAQHVVAMFGATFVFPLIMIARLGSSPMMIGKTKVAPNIATTCCAPMPTVRGHDKRSSGATASPNGGVLPSP